MTAPENAMYVYIGALIDELVRSGVTHLCLCPGSRSTPLALCAARHPGIRTWTLIDERSAAFFALGLAKSLRAPAAVLSTSGTAAANFLPAVVEAHYGRVPLVVLTADRPHELRDCGANQTIDQIRLYGAHAKWFADLALPEASDGALRYVSSLACQAVASALEQPAGPVHLNVPLREPLMPTAAGALPAGATPSGALPAGHERPPEDRRDGPAWDGRPGGFAYSTVSRSVRAPDPGTVAALAEQCGRQRRGLIVCGPSDDPALPDAVGRLAAALGYPILADPLSQVRCGPHDRSLVIDSYDAMLRVDALAATLVPQVILRLGGTPASRPLLQYLQHHGRSRQVVVDVDGGWTDPLRVASDIVWADARLFCEALLTGVRPGAVPASRQAPAAMPANAPWADLWLRLGATTRDAIRHRLEALDEPFEGKVFAELSELLPDGATLYVGNSMPVRDLDTFLPGVPKAIRMLGNRGASGIDGLVSSALGVAAAGGGPVALVVGDLGFYHDLNGLLAAKLHRLRATIVVLNNDGGGIFSFMPQAGVPEHFEALFGTPTGLEFRFAAEMYGAAFARADSWEAFRAQVRAGLDSGGVEIVELRTNRDRNVVLHREVWSGVEDVLRDATIAAR